MQAAQRPKVCTRARLRVPKLRYSRLISHRMNLLATMRHLVRAGESGNLHLSAATNVDLGRLQVSSGPESSAPAGHGNRYVRLSASILSVVVFLALCLWIIKALLAGQFGRTPTVRNLQL